MGPSFRNLFCRLKSFEDAYSLNNGPNERKWGRGAVNPICPAFLSGYRPLLEDFLPAASGLDTRLHTLATVASQITSERTAP
jgi:hypothetical protein